MMALFAASEEMMAVKDFMRNLQPPSPPMVILVLNTFFGSSNASIHKSLTIRLNF
jgi:hypothetical protein